MKGWIISGHSYMEISIHFLSFLLWWLPSVRIPTWAWRPERTGPSGRQSICTLFVFNRWNIWSNISHRNYIFAITGWPCQQETRLQHLDLGGGGYSSHIGVFCLSFHNTRQEKTHMKLFYSFNCLQEIQNNCPFIILKFLMFSEVDSFSPSFVSAWRI